MFRGFANDGCRVNRVQDKVCLIASRTLAPGNLVERIYNSNTPVTATGYFKLLSAPPGAVVLIQNLNQGVAKLLTTGETVAFTFTNLTTIIIASIQGGTVTYELSLTPRYSL